MTQAEASELFAVLVAAYNPDLALPEQTSQIYERMFADLDYDATHGAVIEHIANRKFFPRVSEIRERVLRGQLGAPSCESALAALSAPGSLKRENRERLHPLVLAALRLCGGAWEMNFTQRPGEWRRQFRQVYENLTQEAIFRLNVGGLKLSAAPPLPQLEENYA